MCISVDDHVRNSPWTEIVYDLCKPRKIKIKTTRRLFKQEIVNKQFCHVEQIYIVLVSENSYFLQLKQSRQKPLTVSIYIFKTSTM